MYGVHDPHGSGVLAQGQARVGGGVQQHVFWGAGGDHQAAGVAAFRAQVNQPVAGTNHIEVVFNDDQRMPSIEQLAHGAHEFGDVVKVQAGGGLVKHEQGATLGGGLAALGGAFGGLGQKTGQLQALGLAA